MPYFYHPGYYYPPVYHNGYWPSRQLPSVDPNLLYQSANETKKLMNDASIVLNKLSVSKEFDAQIMSAAQASNLEEVKRLIRSIGIKSTVEVKYTPDGLRLEFSSAVVTNDCCRLIIALRWR